LNQTLHWAKT